MQTKEQKKWGRPGNEATVQALTAQPTKKRFLRAELVIKHTPWGQLTSMVCVDMPLCKMMSKCCCSENLVGMPQPSWGLSRTVSLMEMLFTVSCRHTVRSGDQVTRYSLILIRRLLTRCYEYRRVVCGSQIGGSDLRNTFDW